MVPFHRGSIKGDQSTKVNIVKPRVNTIFQSCSSIIPSTCDDMWPPCIQNAMDRVQGEGARLQDRDVDVGF